MTDLIPRARKEWCEPSGLRPIFVLGDAFNRCPPDVVAALLDLMLESRAFGYNADRDMVCAICGEPAKEVGFGDWIHNHAKDCPLFLAETAITRALEGK